MNTSFQAFCEAAAAEWSVPAVAVGTAVGDDVSVVAVGLRARHACSGSRRSRSRSRRSSRVGLLDLDETTGVWPADVRVRHLLSHTSGFDCELAERDLARFGDGDDALARCVDELPAVRRFVGVDAGLVVREHRATGSRATSPRDRAGATLRGGARRRASCVPFGLESTVVRRARPRRHRAGRGRKAPYPRARRPSGGLVSTVARHPALRAAARSPSRRSRRCARVHGQADRRRLRARALRRARRRRRGLGPHRARTAASRARSSSCRTHGAVFVGLTNSGSVRRRCTTSRTRSSTRCSARAARVPSFVELAAGAARGATPGRYENSDMSAEIRAAPGGLVLAVGRRGAVPPPARRAAVRGSRRAARPGAHRLPARRPRAARQPARRARPVIAAASRPATRRPPRPAPRSSPTAARPPTRRSRHASPRASPRP